MRSRRRPTAAPGSYRGRGPGRPLRWLGDDVIALATGVCLVGVVATCLATHLRQPGIVGFGLAVFVLAFAEILVVSVALSMVDAYERHWFLVALAVIATASVASVAFGHPTWPTLRCIGVARELLQDRVLAVLVALVAVELLYLVALAVVTPPVEGDVLAYHLTRALLWIQGQAISPTTDASDPRINEFPPSAQVLQGATMLLSDSMRWVALPQLGALAACVLSVYGIGRRLGLTLRQGAFGALLVPTLPVVALQAPTALNDLLVATLVAVATFFALGHSPADLGLAALTIALLVSTKGTGLFALPILFVLAVMTHRGGRLVVALSLGVGATALGGAWYVLNVLNGRTALGASDRSISSDDGVVPIAARVTRYAVETIELPGGIGKDRLLYVCAAVLVAVVCLLTRGPRTAVAAGGLTALPLLVLPLERIVHSVYWNGWELVGYREATGLGAIRDPTVASASQSWYGPIGFALTLAGLLLVVRSWRRGTFGSAAVVMAVAPVVFVVESAILIEHHDQNGRYAMGGFLLGASVWGQVRNSTPIAIAVVAVAATTMLLALVNYLERPAGIDLLEGSARQSIWTLPRAWAMSTQPEVSRMIAFTDDNVPAGTPIAVARSASNPAAYAGYPRIVRSVVYADSLEEATRRRVEWAILPLQTACAPRWKRAFRSPPWAMYRHDPFSRCR